MKKKDLSEILSGHTTKEEKEAIKKIVEAYKFLPRKEGIKAFNSTVDDLVELAEYCIGRKDYDTAADHYELAAYACSIAPYRTVRKRGKEFRKKAKSLRGDYRNKESYLEQGALEPSFLIAIIGSFILSLIFIAPSFTGFVISDFNFNGANVFGVLFFILGIFLIITYFRKLKAF